MCINIQSEYILWIKRNVLELIVWRIFPMRALCDCDDFIYNPLAAARPTTNTMQLMGFK